MKKDLTKISLFMIILTLFVGCGVKEGSLCINEYKKEAKIEIFNKDNEPKIFKDRLNYFGETSYNDIKSDNKIISGTTSITSRLFTYSGLFSCNEIVINKEKNTVLICGEIYYCDEKLKNEINNLNK